MTCHAQPHLMINALNMSSVLGLSIVGAVPTLAMQDRDGNTKVKRHTVTANVDRLSCSS